jgi:ribosome-associated protein
MPIFPKLSSPTILNTRRLVSTPASSSSAAPTGDDFDFEYESEDPQGQPLTADTSTSYALPDDDAESRALAVAIGKVCWETKGEDLMVLHVAPLVYWTRYMVIATVFSRPQLNAMLAKIEKEAAETFDRRPASPAAGTSAWELLDYGDVVVHVLTADQREYYDLVS